VAIDGPAGSGKSTLARNLAIRLGLPYVNTGLMYRALTRRALDQGVATSDASGLAALVREMRFAIAGSDPPSLTIDRANPGPEVLTPEVEASVSAVARHPEVRAPMAAEQRRLALRGAVVEGRDIGSVVFPGADVKIFLVASIEERAERRVGERKATGKDEDELTRALASRDALDGALNPFVRAEDAVAIDTTGLDPDGVLSEALIIVYARLGRAP
jgi:CMP/dCMP kinase